MNICADTGEQQVPSWAYLTVASNNKHTNRLVPAPRGERGKLKHETATRKQNNNQNTNKSKPKKTSSSNNRFKDIIVLQVLLSIAPSEHLPNSRKRKDKDHTTYFRLRKIWHPHDECHARLTTVG